MEITSEFVKELLHREDVRTVKVDWKKIGKISVRPVVTIEKWGGGKEEAEDNEFKFKKLRNFSYYIERYFDACGLTFDFKLIKKIFFDKNYYLVPFEFKIGLLKYVCEDLGVYYWDVIANMHDDFPDYLLDSTEKVLNICPKEFLKSIVE